MTTPRQYTDPISIPPDPSMEQVPPDPAMEQVPPDSAAATGHQVEPSSQQASHSSQQYAAPPDVTPQSNAVASGPSGEGALLAEPDLADLRTQWNDVQAGFVDDPRQCVQRADGLVSSAVEQLTANFAQTRSRLEEQWSRGEDASTEDLRIALKRYRDFFDRLLAV